MYNVEKKCQELQEIGEGYFNSKKYDLAIVSFNEEMNLVDKTGGLKYTEHLIAPLSRSYKAIGEYHKAIKVLDKYLIQEKDSAYNITGIEYIKFLRAGVLLDLGDKRSAEKEYRDLINNGFTYRRESKLAISKCCPKGFMEKMDIFS